MTEKKTCIRWRSGYGEEPGIYTRSFSACVFPQIWNFLPTGASYNQQQCAVWCSSFFLLFERELKLSCGSNTYTEKRRKMFCTTKGIILLQQISRSVNSLFDTVTFQDFVLAPKETDVRENPRRQKISKSQFYSKNLNFCLFYIEFIPSSRRKSEVKDEGVLQTEIQKPLVKQILKSHSMLNPSQLEKSQPILKKIDDTPDIPVNEGGILTVGHRTLSI